DDLSEGTLSASTLLFTPANWYLPHVATVTGVDDMVSDGDVGFSIVTSAASSADPKYDGQTVDDVTVTNSDDDVAEVHVTPIVALTTTEAGGSATFSI